MESSRSATMTTSKSTGWFAMSSDVVIVNVCDGLGGIQFNKCINMENKALLERCCEKERKKKSKMRKREREKDGSLDVKTKCWKCVF